MLRRLSLFLVLLSLAACSDGTEPSVLAPGPDFGRERAGPGALSVLTWNVYYGADLDVLLLPSEDPLPVRVARVFGQVQATDAEARAEAMADQIAASRPDLVGLQEVARYRLESPGDFLDENGDVVNPFPDAQTEVFDFVDLLRDALADRGLDYVEASRTETFDVELPMFTPDTPEPPFTDLRLTESVAILARSDLETDGTDGAVFEVNLQVTVEGFPIEITKGWASVDAVVKGRTYRFVTTHLEPADFDPGVQRDQAEELLDLDAVDQAEVPVILTGDLNSEPDAPADEPYGQMTSAGFVDTWLVGRPRGDGFTANQDADLLNEDSGLWHRIDYVLYRDDVTEGDGPFRGSVHAERLGEGPSDRTPGGLWPSDHAGVFATLRTAQEAR